MAGQRNRTPAKAVNGVNTLTPRLNNNARKPTSGRNTSRNHLCSGLRHRQLPGVENEKAQHQHADQAGPTRSQHGRNAGTAIDPRFEQHWHNQPQPGDTKPEPPCPETAAQCRHQRTHFTVIAQRQTDKNATSRKISPHTTGISIRCTKCASVECGLLRWRIAMAISATAAPDEMPEKRNSTAGSGY